MIQARFGIVGIESLECYMLRSILRGSITVCWDLGHTVHTLSLPVAVVSSGLLPRDPLSTSKMLAARPAISRGSKFMNE